MGGHKLSDLWPSSRPSTGREGKGPKPQSIPTDWLSGWTVTLFVVLLVTAVAVTLGATLWPFVADAVDTIQRLSDTLPTSR